MNKTKFQRVISLALALMMVASCTVLALSAKDSAASSESKSSSVTDSTIDDVKEILNSTSYSAYFEKYSEKVTVTNDDGTKTTHRVWTVDAADKAITIDPIRDINADKTDAKWQEGTYDGEKALFTPSEGTVTWNVRIPKTARYSIVIEYYPVLVDENGKDSKATNIERILRINSAVPFLEARYLTLPKTYANEYIKGEYLVGKDETATELLARATELGIVAESVTRENATYIIYDMPEVWTEGRYQHLFTELNVRFFISDIDDNEIRPTIVQAPQWTSYEVSDPNGYYAESFEFVFEASNRTTISLTGVNEPMAIKSIRLIPHETYQSYDELSKSFSGEAAGTSTVKLEGEYLHRTTSQTIYPIEDNRSAINSPNAAAYTMLNSIGGVGGEKWQTSGQELSYKMAVDNSGMYNIVARFSQSTLDGMFTSRQLQIHTNFTEAEYKEKFGDLKGYYDGVPCTEAAQLRFDYSSKWQTKILSDGETELAFYFREGVEYTITLGVTLGTMGDIVGNVESILETINSAYLSILKLTGAEPDQYRDYGFIRIMPEVIEDIIESSAELTEIAQTLQSMAGVKGSMVATLEQVAWLLDRMGGDPEQEIARNLTQLKSNIGSLGTWISDAKTQPLQIDYLLIQGVGNELPRAEANFFQMFAFEMGRFFRSFFRNYDRMGTMVEVDESNTDVVEVWLVSGRDQTQIVRSLVNSEFTPQYGHAVNLKLVAGGTLLPSILSGKGPDVYIGLGDDDVINYALRGALMSIEHLDGFSEMVEGENKVFNEAAMIVLSLEDATGTEHVYGLPETQSFSMMFVRQDILAELGLDIPKTWDELLSMIPVLQAANMQIGMPNDYKLFLYQMGGDLFADNGMRINLDSNVALDSFEMMCNLFTMYSFPYDYNFANRFRTGEMPIGIANYTATYNQLKVFATEIEGLWGMYPLPGIEDENGEINNVAISGTAAIVMVNGCDNVEGAWDFMKWHSGTSFQSQYANEMVALLGPSAKHNTANIQVLESLPWSTEELKQIKLQFNNLASIPNYPGHYILGRYTNFAFLAAFNDNDDPAESLLQYINTINKEITRKRAEFDLETLEIGQKLSGKRIDQTIQLLDEGELVLEKGEYRTDKKGEQYIEMVKSTYTVKNQNSAVLAEMIENLVKAKDEDNFITREEEIAIVAAVIAELEALPAGGDDQVGLTKAIELLNDALTALESYKD